MLLCAKLIAEKLYFAELQISLSLHMLTKNLLQFYVNQLIELSAFVWLALPLK